jgi:YkoY family integral membrane protein
VGLDTAHVKVARFHAGQVLRSSHLDIHAADLVTIALLVALEGLLSADNAMVLAVLVLGLPRRDQRKALQYGIVGAFAFRVTAILLAVYLIRIAWVMLIGALYLLWLPYHHFFGHADAETRRAPRRAAPWLGLTAFWATVVKVELTDIVFAIDSILVAVAMSNKTWVIITGGILGVIAMRLVIGQLLVLVNRYPALVDGAFVIIAWVGIKLLLEYLHTAGVVHFEIPRWLSLGLVVVIFVVAFIWAKIEGPQEPPAVAERAEDLLAVEGAAIDRIDGNVQK